jgi:DNA-binding transcriptional MerR regulator
MSTRNTFSIGQVAKMTGTTVRQIRRWSDSGIIPPAERETCGDIKYRRYNQKHVDFVSRIKGFLDEGYTLSHAHALAVKGPKKGGAN